MNTFPVLLGALCVYALAYRYYSAFIAAKALALSEATVKFHLGNANRKLGCRRRSEATAAAHALGVVR